MRVLHLTLFIDGYGFLKQGKTKKKQGDKRAVFWNKSLMKLVVLHQHLSLQNL